MIDKLFVYRIKPQRFEEGEEVSFELKTKRNLIKKTHLYWASKVYEIIENEPIVCFLGAENGGQNFTLSHTQKENISEEFH